MECFTFFFDKRINCKNVSECKEKSLNSIYVLKFFYNRVLQYKSLFIMKVGCVQTVV